MGPLAGSGRMAWWAAALCGLALAAVALSGSASAAAQQREWLVSGSLTGTYSNSVTWVNCLDTGASGTASERVRVNATLSHGSPGLYRPGSGLFVAGTWHGGGTWSVSGSNPPRTEQPDETVTCGAQRPFHCAGPLHGGGDGVATIVFHPLGKLLFGHFLRNDSFVEGDNPCPSVGPTLGSAGPMYGLGGTLIERDAFAENTLKHASLVIPRARLEGHAPFTMSHAASPDGGCPRLSLYTHCTESGRLTLTLHFSRAR